MKLLVISSMTPTCTANYLVRALRVQGHVLLVCSDVASELADLRVRGAVDVPGLCAQLRFEPDAVLFFEGGSMQVLPVGLARMRCLTAWYGIDTHMDYAKHLRIGRLFDVSFIAQKEYVESLRQDGLKQVHWLPLGFAPELMPDEMPERNVDLAYVGSDSVLMHPQRHALLAALKREFASTRFGMAAPRDMARIYAGARIVFNRCINNDVNMRFFEAMGAGAVLLTDRVVDNGVEDLFVEGEHYVSYVDEQSLIHNARSLLDDPARCERIGRAARELVVRRHTYSHRAQQLIDCLAAAVKQRPPACDDEFAACLSLSLASAALGRVVQSLREVCGGRFNRVTAHVAAGMVAAVAAMVGSIEWLRRLSRGR